MEIKLHEKSNENKVTKLPKRVTEKYSNKIVLFKYRILNTKVHSCTFSLILEHNKFLRLKKLLYFYTILNDNIY